MAIFSNQVWFSNRRAKWRRHQRMNLLQPSQHPPGSAAGPAPTPLESSQSGQLASQHPLHHQLSSEEDNNRTKIKSNNNNHHHSHRQVAQQQHQHFGIRGQRRPTPVCIRVGSPTNISRPSSCSPQQRPRPPPLDETSVDSTTNELNLVNDDDYDYDSTGDVSDDGNCSDSEAESDISVVSSHQRLEEEEEQQQEEALDLKKTRSISSYSPSREQGSTVSGR